MISNYQSILVRMQDYRQYKISTKSDKLNLINLSIISKSSLKLTQKG